MSTETLFLHDESKDEWIVSEKPTSEQFGLSKNTYVMLPSVLGTVDGVEQYEFKAIKSNEAP